MFLRKPLVALSSLVVSAALASSPALADPPTVAAVAPEPPQATSASVPTSPASETSAEVSSDGLVVEEKTTAEFLEVIERSIVGIESLKDYSCVFVKREIVNGRPQEQQYIFLKVRREPFSVYLHYLRPSNRMGQEAIYVDGVRSNKLIAHGVGWQKKLAGAMELEPTSDLAMRGSRHPITSVGMEHLVRTVARLPETEPGFQDMKVRFFPDRLVAGRKCLGVEIAHTRVVEGSTFLAMRLYFDEATSLPLRQELWQRGADGRPQLSEEYTYADVKTNRGYKDRDFDPKNPVYDYD